MKVCVLGHGGMLGSEVVRFLSDAGHAVATIPVRFAADQPGKFLAAIVGHDPDWCVNCIGLAPGPDVAREILWETNAELPAALSRNLPRQCGLIHASTDGVFRPEKAEREFDEPPDATDDYGLAKRQAEQALTRSNDFIIRCSIIGLDPPGRTRSLLSWFLSQEGEVGGYDNQMWNGITTLQWARFADGIIGGNHDQRVLQPAFAPAISKFRLLQLFAELWERPVTITPSPSPNPVARSLVANVETPPIAEQLRELRESR